MQPKLYSHKLLQGSPKETTDILLDVIEVALMQFYVAKLTTNKAHEGLTNRIMSSMMYSGGWL